MHILIVWQLLSVESEFTATTASTLITVLLSAIYGSLLKEQLLPLNGQNASFVDFDW